MSETKNEYAKIGSRTRTLYEEIYLHKEIIAETLNSSVLDDINIWKTYIEKHRNEIDSCLTLYEKEILPQKHIGPRSPEILYYRLLSKEYTKYLNYKQSIANRLEQLKQGDVLYLGKERYVFSNIKENNYLLTDVSGNIKQFTKLQLYTDTLIIKKQIILNKEENVHKQKKDLFQELYPNQNSVTFQGSYGNCYKLANIDYAKSKTEFKDIIRDRFKKTSRGRSIRFMGTTLRFRESNGYSDIIKVPGEYINITHEDIFKRKKVNRHIGSINEGDILFEIGYAILMHNRYLRHFGKKHTGKITIEKLHNTFYGKNNAMAFEEGYGDQFIQDLYGIKNGFERIGRKILKNRKLNKTRQGKSKSFWANSKPKRLNEGKKGTYMIKDINGNSHYIPYGHAYRIKHIKNKIIRLIDPLFTGKEIKINEQDFPTYFFSMYNHKTSRNKEKFQSSRSKNTNF